MRHNLMHRGLSKIFHFFAHYLAISSFILLRNGRARKIQRSSKFISPFVVNHHCCTVALLYAKIAEITMSSSCDIRAILATTNTNCRQCDCLKEAQSAIIIATERVGVVVQTMSMSFRLNCEWWQCFSSTLSKLTSNQLQSSSTVTLPLAKSGLLHL